MTAIHFRKTLQDDIPQLPELCPFLGKTVDLIVYDGESPPITSLEDESIFFGLLPKDDNYDLEKELVKLREMAKSDPCIEAFLNAREAAALDVERIIYQRGIE